LQKVSIGYSPFSANIGYHTCWMVREHPKLPTNLTVEDRLTQLQKVQATLAYNLYDAQNTQKKVADRARV
jgi:hypothetical protein